jgi:hypothetical protein
LSWEKYRDQLLTIQLPDGLSTEMDESEWLQLASANCHHLTEKGYFDSDLIVRKHSDDRMLVYVVVKNPEGDTTASGEMLLPGTTDVESHILRVAQQFDLSEQVQKTCVTAFRRAISG